MTALLESARRTVRRRPGLDDRLEGLAEAVQACRGRIDSAADPGADPGIDTALDQADQVVARAHRRLRLSADHTVVALAGATGSGKSSTFNALAGLDLARVGIRRPTTSYTTACLWGGEGAEELLEWLGIPPRNQVSRDSVIDTAEAREQGRRLEGLVLLDLPDHDSTEVAHHLEAERLVGMADLLVWVLDPQKYADLAIHDRFLRPMAGNQDVMLVALNHIDSVAPERRDAMLGDVRRLLADDGLDGVPVLAVSARTGEGLGRLRQELATRVSDKAATRARLTGDLAAATTALTGVVGVEKPGRLGARDHDAVVAALSQAAGVPVVVDAVRRASTLRARRATGWPVTAWLSRLKPDPLRRLHLDLGGKNKDLVLTSRTSVPTADAVQRAQVEASVRELTDQMGRDLARPWSRAVRRAATSRFDDLEDRLDGVLARTDLGVETVPWWAKVVRLLQWLLLALALAGALWLTFLFAASYLQLGAPAAPRRNDVPVPTLLLLLGVLAGVLLALLSRALVGLSSRSRARRADRRLRAGVAEVAEELVLAPAEAVLEDYRTAYDALQRARG